LRIINKAVYRVHKKSYRQLGIMQAPNNSHDAGYFKDSSYVHNCQLQLLIIIEAGIKFNLMEVFGKPAEAGTALEGFD
jgi:hypothetical protein